MKVASIWYHCGYINLKQTTTQLRLQLITVWSNHCWNVQWIYIHLAGKSRSLHCQTLTYFFGARDLPKIFFFFVVEHFENYINENDKPGTWDWILVCFVNGILYILFLFGIPPVYDWRIVTSRSLQQGNQISICISFQCSGLKVSHLLICGKRSEI